MTTALGKQPSTPREDSGGWEGSGTAVAADERCFDCGGAPELFATVLPALPIEGHRSTGELGAERAS